VFAWGVLAVRLQPLPHHVDFVRLRQLDPLRQLLISSLVVRDLSSAYHVERLRVVMESSPA
jgi:hypothetical protein